MAIGINPYGNTGVPQGYDPLTTQDLKGTDKAAGAGNLKGAGKAPDAPAPSTMGAVMASLSAMMPKVSGQALDTLLLEVTSKMKDTIGKSEKDKIETDTSAKRTQIGEKQAKMKEATEKMEAAQNKLKDMSVWDKIKLGFQYLGAILSIVAGVLAAVAGAAAIATGVLAPAGIAAVVGGGLLIASGVMMLYMAADATHAALDKDGLGFRGADVRRSKLKEGASEDEALQAAGKAEMIAKVTIGAVAAVLAIAGSLLTLPLGGAVSLPSLITGITSGVNQMAMGAGDLTVGILKNQANQEKASATEKKAEAKQMEAVIQSLDDMIDLAMSRLKGAGQRFDAMLDSLTDAIKDRGDTMSRVGFRA